MLQRTFDADAILKRLKRRLDQVQPPTDGRLWSFGFRFDFEEVRRPARLGADLIYWSEPAHGRLRMAAGRALSVRAFGRDHIHALAETFGPWRRDWVVAEQASPAACLGFCFSPGRGRETLPDAALNVPLVLFESGTKGAVLTFSAGPEAPSEPQALRRRWLSAARRILYSLQAEVAPSAEVNRILWALNMPGCGQWRARVEAAVAAIRRGQAQKLVLSRRMCVGTERPLRPGALIHWLAMNNPRGVHFAYPAGDHWVVGATPERLLSVRGDTVHADALAGTGPLPAGSLLSDPKSRHEQSLVTRDLLQRLQGHCSELRCTSRPRIRRQAGVEHLWTPVRGRLQQGDLLELAAQVHPTPAVGGYPRESALDWLSRNGEERRGWYSGGFGWMLPDGSGDLHVNLRSARIRGRVAELSAGAGIVADSDPEAELRETEWKLDSMLQALRSA
ncbi:MAG: isochorismate synthase [Chromatiales bacterium]|nr:isochorismate synthase [Chromatiales bacterium]